MKAVGCQPKGWAPSMSYEGCRLPTYRLCRFGMGPPSCRMKAAGCRYTGIGCRWGVAGPSLMSYEGCRLPIYSGSRVEDGVD